MRVAIRADADAAIGSGHLMRCLALAQGLIDARHDVTFITFCTSAPLLQRLTEEAMPVTRLENPDDHEGTLGTEADAVVLDGYGFDTALQRQIRARGRRLMVIDDFVHLDAYEADVILNQNPGASAERYRAGPGVRMLMGPKHVLLRREFREADPGTRRFADAANRVLVTLGGGDVRHRIHRVVEALAEVSATVETRVLAGGVRDMASEMAWADCAIAAGGTTMLELAYMGVPTLACVVADNQESGVAAFAGEGVVRSLGWLDRATNERIAAAVAALLPDRGERERMGQAGMARIDGRGVDRVIAALEG